MGEGVVCGVVDGGYDGGEMVVSKGGSEGGEEVKRGLLVRLGWSVGGEGEEVGWKE